MHLIVKVFPYYLARITFDYWRMVMTNCLIEVIAKCYIKVPNAWCDIAILVTDMHLDGGAWQHC